MAQYPTSVPSFATKQDGVDYPQASHINDVQDEITAIGDGLKNGLQHALTVSTGGLTVSTGATTLGDDLSVAGTITAAAQPRCLVYSTVSQSFASGAFTAVTFTAQDFNVGSLHSTGSNPSRITVPAGSSGLYMFGATVFWSTGASGDRGFIRLLKNSTTEVGIVGTVQRSSGAAHTAHVQQPVVMDGGDYCEVQAFAETSTGSMPAAGAFRRVASQFWAVKLW